MKEGANNMNHDEQELYLIAQQHLNNSYSPYSHFKVAACLKTRSGQIFTGVNIENASYGATICAERVALFEYVNSGAINDPIELLLVYGNTDRPISPCGSCRQVMTEFMSAQTRVLLTDHLGDYKQTTLDELIPYYFNQEDLADGANK